MRVPKTTEEPPERSRISKVKAGPSADGRHVYLVQRQRRVSANWREVRDFIGTDLRLVTPRPFTVGLVSEKRIQQLNQDFRQHDEPTDVLSFPFDDRSDYLGDIAISAETAQRQAREFGVRTEDEVKLLALHGLLHLLGYDHETDGGEMRRQEKSWVVRFGLPHGLIERTTRAKSARTSRQK